MPIEIDIAYVARLARTKLSEQELDRYREQLGVILDHAARIQSLPTDGVPPTAHPLPLDNAFRPDELGHCLDRDEVLAQAPDREGHFFRLPRILEEEEA